jgi:starch-binding outer membrane protein, SusD/RagB family
MKMARIFSIVFIAISLMIAVGCSDWLDIKPESQVVLEDFWQDETQVNQVSSACYRLMTESDVMSKMLVWGELRSDNVTFGYDVSEDMSEILNIDITPTNGYNQWGSFYTIINNCNTFLYYAPDVVKLDKNFSESELHSLEAEVLTIRALTYFYLIRTFKKVPWTDTPSIDDTQDYMIPDTTSEFILGKIVADLETALPNALDKFDRPEYTKGRITKNAIRALLADIHLWQQDYNACVQMCDQILDDSEQGLMLVDGKEVLKKVFIDGNSTESIFELQYDKNERRNEIIDDYYGVKGDEKGKWSFPSNLILSESSSIFNIKIGSGYESENDLRAIDFLNQKLESDKYFIFKYAGRRDGEDALRSSYTYRSSENTVNWIVYRLSDVILMKAEALIQLGTNDAEAMELINITYLRSNPDLGVGLKLENYNSKSELEKLILRERQRELMFEGKRWFDLMRLVLRANETTPLLNYVRKKFSTSSTAHLVKMSIMDALYLPIHPDELRTNRALQQNPYYELTGEDNY